MKMYNKIYQLSQLQLLKKRLEAISNRKLFESKNKKNDDKKKIMIATGENRNIFSGIPSDIIDYLKKQGDFDTEVINFENKEITMENYWDILDTIKFLLNIIEYDLIKAYCENNKYIIETE